MRNFISVTLALATTLLPAAAFADDDTIGFGNANAVIVMRDVRRVHENNQADTPLMITADVIVHVKTDKTKEVLSPTIKRVRIAHGGTPSCPILAATALPGLSAAEGKAKLELRIVVDPTEVKIKTTTLGEQFVSLGDGIAACEVARTAPQN